MTEQNDALVEALVKVQADLTAVKKGETADTGTYTYRYADLADITRVVYPLLSKHGLAFITAPQYRDGRYTLVGTLEHISGGSREAEFPLPFHDRITPQQIGSAITYGRRYLLGCLVGVVTEEDDDGEAASTVPPVKKQAPKKQRQPLPQMQAPREPDPEWDDFAKQEDAPPSDGITKAQQAKLHLLFNGNGLKDRNERLAFTSGLIKRDVASSNELTKVEASKLIDHLEHLLSKDPT